MATSVSCDQLGQFLGEPAITIGESELNFGIDADEVTFTLNSTRDWKVENDAEWVIVSPESGSASAEDQTITVTVLENKGMDRTADLKFTIGMISKYLTVNQAGPSGSAEDLVVYGNDFDVEKALNNNGWPYLDSNTNLWDNKKGTGASAVTYAYGGKVSVRTSGKLSNDTGGYSHYAGSGMNKVFFGAATSTLMIKNIAIGDSRNFTISYGGQKYLQGADSNFSFDELKLYLSNDGQKWALVNMAFPSGADIDGDWNHATADVTVPAGTGTLNIAFVCSASSAYSIDDVLLQVSDNAGQNIDFSTGITIDGTTSGGNTGGDTGGSTGGDTTKPSTLKKVTVAEFLAAAEDDTWYELTGEIISIAKETYGNFTIKDATGEIYIYGMTNGWVGSNNQSFSQIGLKVGDTVTLGTKRTSYNGTAQGGGSSIPAYYISHVAGEGSGNQGGGEVVTPPAGGDSVYEPGITWTLGEKAYDNTSGTNAQTGTINGVKVNNMLKLGTGSLVGDATLNVPAGTAKLGFYCVAWKGKKASLKFSVNGTEISTVTPAANAGATGNPPYTITLADSDYYEVTMPSAAAASVKVETLDKANGRVIIIGLKAIAQ